MKNVWIIQGYGCDGPEVFTSSKRAYDYALPMMSEKISYRKFLASLRRKDDNNCWCDTDFDLSVCKKRVNPYQAL